MKRNAEGWKEGREEEGEEDAEGRLQGLTMDANGTQGLAFIGLAQAVKDDGLRLVKANWQVLGLAAAVVAGGTRTLVEVERLGQRVVSIEAGQGQISAQAVEAATLARSVLGEIRELRKDLRAMKPGTIQR